MKSLLWALMFTTSAAKIEVADSASQAEATASKLSAKAIKLVTQGSVDEAVGIFEEAAQLAPQTAGHWANLGMAQASLALTDDARASFARGLALDPTHETILKNLANLDGGDSGAAAEEGGASATAADGAAADGADEEEDGRSEIVSALTLKAIALAEGGNAEAAYSLFQQASNADPHNGKALENVGVSLLRLNRIAEARVAFEAALALPTTDAASIAANLAALEEHEEFARLVGAGNGGDDHDADGPAYDDDDEEDAEDEAAAAEANALTTKAIARAQAGDLRGALDLFERAVDANPDDSLMWENLAVTQMRLGLLDEARESFTGALARDKEGRASLKENLAALEEHVEFVKTNGNAASVAASYEYEEYADEGKAEDEAARAEDAAVLKAASARVQKLTEHAIAKAEGGDLEGAMGLFQAAVDAQPANARVHDNLGVTQMRLGLLDAALESFERVAKLQGGKESVQMAAYREHLAHAEKIGHDTSQMYAKTKPAASEDDEEEYYEEDDEEEASGRAYLLAKIQKFTTDAIAKAEAGDLMGALELFQSAVHADPTGPNLHDNLGVTQMRLGLLDAARASFTQAETLSGKKSDNLKALKDHEEYAAKIGHDTSKMYSEMAKGAAGDDEEGYYSEDDADAEEALEAKIKESTDGAISKAEAGDLVGALRLFQKAISLSPGTAKQHENLGVTQMRLGLLDAARASFIKAQELAPKGSSSTSLDDNFKALEEHDAYAESIGHDPKTMYSQYTDEGDDDEDEDEDDAYVGEADPATADRLTQKAIKLANANELEEALELFQDAVSANPKSGQMWENLGVTQMRANNLDDAARSFKKARKLDKTLDSKNLDALQEHVAFHAKNGGGGGGSGGGSHGGSHGGSGRKGLHADALTIGLYSADDLGELDATVLELTDEDSEFDLDLRAPFGVFLSPGARVVKLAEDLEGQFQKAGVLPGDRVVGVGDGGGAVYTLHQFKQAVAAQRAAGFNAVPVIVRRNSFGGSDDDDGGGGGGGNGNIKLPNLDGAASEDALVKVAIKYVGDGDPAAALPYFLQAAVNSPTKANLWMNVGNCQRDVGQFAAAMESYQKALALDPGNELLLENLSRFQADHEGDLGGGGGGWFGQANGEGFCDDGITVDTVRVGDKVEVRDGDGAWSSGTVESINDETGQPSVAKDGWDMGYEWEQCRRKGKGGRGEL